MTVLIKLGLKSVAKQYDDNSLGLTTKLLRANPEYYTIWNHRRRIIRHIAAKLKDPESLESQNFEHRKGRDLNLSSVASFYASDLDFLIPLLRQYPKCYWIWKYRLWLLEEASRELCRDNVRKLWSAEMQLVRKMLSLDCRNFHGWGYRRHVSERQISLASPNILQPKPGGAQNDFDYTTQMINQNLSNFSAWHYRGKAIPSLLDDRQADDAARRQFLNDEFKLIERALWADAQDQSLWFYHDFLLRNVDCESTRASFVPHLQRQEQLEVIKSQISLVEELLQAEEDDEAEVMIEGNAQHHATTDLENRTTNPGKKYVLQALISLHSMQFTLDPTEDRQDIIQAVQYAQQLVRLDPLRRGRWQDVVNQFTDRGSIA